MLKKLSALILKLLGWQIIGESPKLRKYVLIVAPHTSNWDFVLGVFARKVIGINMHYMGKSSLFKPPHGFLFRWLGGFPVDRSKPNGLVNAAVELFKSREDFILVLSPEGTRKYNPNWKTGFWHIAHEANVPIAIVSFDYSTKEITYKALFYTTADKTADIRYIKSLFLDVKGLHPELGVLEEL